jgi:organic radical activating enzyme
MKDVARVIVTYDCPRNCPNCCNEHIGNIPVVKFEDLLKYKELVITGGEPMEIAPRVLEMIHRLRTSGYKGKIWLYTSRIKTARWADRAVLQEVDGITYTLHHKPSKNDLSDARKLNKFLLENRKHDRSDRLLIDSRCYTEEVLSIIGLYDTGTKHWSSIKSLVWKDDECPLPDNEELVYYDLERE